jgi:thymidylate synthase
MEQAALQLSREPRALPQLVMKDRGQDIFDYEADDFAFEAYDPHPHISAPVAV